LTNRVRWVTAISRRPSVDSRQQHHR